MHDGSVVPISRKAVRLTTSGRQRDVPGVEQTTSAALRNRSFRGGGRERRQAANAVVEPTPVTVNDAGADELSVDVWHGRRVKYADELSVDVAH